MIGSGLKKFATENGLKVAKGVAYGSLRGFAATLSEGSGYKMIVLTTKFTDAQKQNELQAQLNSRNITRDFRVRSLNFAANGISVVFNDTIGTMGKIKEFADWFFPLLAESSATTAEICTECGTPITAGTWKLIDGVAFHMHETCAQRNQRIVSEQEQAKRDADTGNYFTGLLGALGGAILGAVVWAIVLNLGYVAALVGLLIGWLADKGYDLLKGKQGKLKIVILIVAIILGVILGTLGGYGLMLAELINEGETYLTYADIPAALVVLMGEPEVLSEFGMNVLMGLLFAGLGVFSMLMQANKQVSGTKIDTLE